MRLYNVFIACISPLNKQPPLKYPIYKSLNFRLMFGFNIDQCQTFGMGSGNTMSDISEDIVIPI